MTDEQKQIIARINSYAKTTGSDIDSKKTPISVRLQKLRPIMEQIAKEKGMELEDIFVLYMDYQSDAALRSDQKVRDQVKDLEMGSGFPLFYD